MRLACTRFSAAVAASRVGGEGLGSLIEEQLAGLGQLFVVGFDLGCEADSGAGGIDVAIGIEGSRA